MVHVLLFLPAVNGLVIGLEETGHGVRLKIVLLHLNFFRSFGLVSRVILQALTDLRNL